MIDEYPDESLQKFREKRKWQIALRRYVIQEQTTSAYAPYFGIDIKGFRKWIELQFEGELGWGNFGKLWQLDHIIPVVYFDSKDPNELRLCWNFTNIRVEKAQLNKFRGNRVDALTAKSYFQDVFDSTGYFTCYEMIRKIEMLEISQIRINKQIEVFIQENFDHLTSLQNFGEYEFLKLNNGSSVEEILEERAMLMKFGK